MVPLRTFREAQIAYAEITAMTRRIPRGYIWITLSLSGWALVAVGVLAVGRMLG